MAATLEMKGIDALNRYLQRLAVGTPGEVGKSLYRDAKTIIAQAQEYCPVRFGPLRASAHVVPPVIEGSRVSVVMGFGGAAGGNIARGGGEVGYAIPVHENLTAHHPVGQAKYLERAVLEAIPALKQTLAADFAEIFKGVK